MSDEIKITNNHGHDDHNHEQKDNKCFCQSKGFRKFLTIALGTFVGVYFALCLFSALHKPPMMMRPADSFRGYGSAPIAKPCPCNRIMHHHHFKHNHGGEMTTPDTNGRTTPFQEQSSEVIN